MKWILIVMMMHGNGGVAVNSIGFNTQGACETAAKMVKSEDGWTYNVKAFCVANP